LQKDKQFNIVCQYLLQWQWSWKKFVSCCCCRDELKIFAGEVIRFGNHCRDPQWHQLDRVFDRLGLTIEDSRQSKEQADVIMQNLMTLAENTAVRNKMQKPHHHHHHACLLLQIKFYKTLCVCVYACTSLPLSLTLCTQKWSQTNYVVLLF
jgi:hypothetical protein